MTREEIIQFLQHNHSVFKEASFEGFTIETLLELKRLVEVEKKIGDISKKYSSDSDEPASPPLP